jgi:hypothetical protein
MRSGTVRRRGRVTGESAPSASLSMTAPRIFARVGIGLAIVQAMTARLRDDVDLGRVEADVLRVVDRTFHPATASLWLRGAPR